MSPDLGSPRQLALLALHLANFDVTAIDDGFLTQPDTEPFELVFDAGERRSLSLSWNSDGPEWSVIGSFTPERDPAVALEMAISLNALLPPGLRLQEGPSGGVVEVISVRPAEDQPLEDLAEALMEVAAWLHRTADTADQLTESAALERPKPGGVRAGSLQGAELEPPIWAMRV
jgi:hypothetical protein